MSYRGFWKFSTISGTHFSGKTIPIALPTEAAEEAVRQLSLDLDLANTNRCIEDGFRLEVVVERV